MPSLQDEQPPFHRAVCDAMVASCPEDWVVIVLTIERPEGVAAIGQLEHLITSPGQHGSPMPDESLYEATYRLDELFQKHGGVFRKSVYSVHLSPGSRRYTAKFEYDEPSE